MVGYMAPSLANTKLGELTSDEGANEMMASLKTPETKVAYLIQMIAIQLHKASKEIASTVSVKQSSEQNLANIYRRSCRMVPMIYGFTSFEPIPFLRHPRST